MGGDSLSPLKSSFLGGQQLFSQQGFTYALMHIIFSHKGFIYEFEFLHAFLSNKKIGFSHKKLGGPLPPNKLFNPMAKKIILKIIFSQIEFCLKLSPPLPTKIPLANKIL